MKKKNLKLKMVLNMWTMVGYPQSGKKEWSIQKKLKEVAKAGFDGIGRRADSPIAVEDSKKLGLMTVGAVDIGSVSEVKPKLQALKDIGAYHINVQLCDHDTPLSKSLPIAIKIMSESKKLNVKAAIEVHRDTCTETPEKAYELADAYQHKTGKKLLMNFDHSHPAIIKHIQPKDFWNRLGVRLDLLTMGEMIHLRPFNGHHCQIPITDGKGKLSYEFKNWLPFCDKLLETWIETASPGQELVVVPELGPRTPPKGGYGLSCFPDVWEDAKVLSREIRKIWNKHNCT